MRRGTSPGSWLASRDLKSRHEMARGWCVPAPREIRFGLRSAYRADPRAPVATESRWCAHSLEQVRVLSGERDVAGAVERGGLEVSPTANRYRPYAQDRNVW